MRHVIKQLSRMGLVFLSLWIMVYVGVQFIKPQTVLARPQGIYLPPGFVVDTVVSGLIQPTAIDWTRDGRIFIATKWGQVLVNENGTLRPTPFIDISSEVNHYWDKGLLGLAIHPDYPNTPYVYLLHTYDPPGAPPDGLGSRVSRLLRVEADPNDSTIASSNPASRTVLLGKNSTITYTGDVLSNTNYLNPACYITATQTDVEDCIPSDAQTHSIGTVMFGSDGALYVSSGEGAHAFFVDPRALRAQRLTSLGGKVLRIDPISGAGLSDNPFYEADNPNSNRSKVLSYGVRQPFRFTLHPTTNVPYIGDVGWGTWEEIDQGVGKNFGWPCYEGDDTSSARQPGYENDPKTASECAQLYAQGAGAVQPPTYAYNHNGADSAVVAGTFYMTGTYPAQYYGALFIADYSRDTIGYLTFSPSGTATYNTFATDVSPGTGGPVQIKVGPDGNLYYVSFDSGGAGAIRRIRYTGGNTPPSASARATPSNGQAPLVVSFSSDGSNDQDGQIVAYLWNFGDGLTSTLTNLVHTYGISGTYTAVLTVTDNLGAQGSASVQIVVGNGAPLPVITTPLSGTQYNIGDVISFSGSATDGEDGALPANRLAWQAILHHNQHIHPDYFNGVGYSGTFTVTDHGDNTWIELCLTATDSGGLQGRTCRELHPNTVVYTFNTQPSGLTLVYEGVAYVTPFTRTTIVNANQQIIAPTRQSGFQWIAWSDGGAASHIIIIGVTPQTYTATYKVFVWLPIVAR